MKKIIIGLDITLFILPFLISFFKIFELDVPVIKNHIANSSFYEIFVIPMLSLVVLEVFNFKYDYDSFKNKINNDIFDIKEYIKSVEINTNGIRLHNSFKFNELKHPYFKEILNQKFEDFIYENNSIFNNKYMTKPSSRDTFGAEGIMNTKKSLSCVSSIADYWISHENDEYINKQRKLIQNGVEIRRLFVVNKRNYSVALIEMDRQEKIGIKVKAIDEKIMIEGRNFRDYLIQDNTLLVDLVVPKDKNNGDYIEDCKLSHMQADEIITYGCEKRVKEFKNHWNRGIKLEKIKCDSNIFFNNLI